MSIDIINLSTISTSTNYSNDNNNSIRIVKLRREAESMLSIHIVFDSIYKEILRIQLNTDGYLTLSLFKILFKKFKNTITDIFGNIEANDFFDIIDQDNDGFLNEDEILLLFSLIKAKLHTITDKLLKIRDYKLYKELHSVVKILNDKINIYQQSFRNKIFDTQINTFNTQSNIRLSNHYNYSNNRLDTIKELTANKVKVLEMNKKYNLNNIEKNTLSAGNLVRIKPNKNIKLFEVQEKLLALDNRLEEAENLKKRIRTMKETDNIRINRTINYKINNNKKIFLLRYSKLENYNKIKLHNEKNKAVINNERELNTINKQISLKYNSIKKIQNFSSKKYSNIGNNMGELIEMKDRLRKQNNIINNCKKIQSNNNGNSSKDKVIDSNRVRNSSINNISTNNNTYLNNKRKILKLLQSKYIIKFYIRNKYGNQMPVNVKNNNNYNNNKNNITKYLNDNSNCYDNDRLNNITQLYDSNLRLNLNC